MLPGKVVVILVRVVDKCIGAIARHRRSVMVVVVEVGESRLHDSLQPKFAGPISSIAPYTAALDAIAAAVTRIEVVQKVGAEYVVVTEAHIVRPLIGCAGIQGMASNSVLGRTPIVVVAAVDFLLRADVLVDANFVHIGI